MTKVQRYKVGYYTDEWGMASNTPCLIPDDSGYAVKFEDYFKLEAENERLERNLTTTEQTMREYQELAAKRLEEIEWLNGVCDDLKNKNALLSAHTELFREEAYRFDDLSTAYAHRLAHWIEEHDSLLTELAKYRDAPVVAWVEVVDSYEGPYHFNGEKLLNVGKHKLIVKPGEEK